MVKFSNSSKYLPGQVFDFLTLKERFFKESKSKRNKYRAFWMCDCQCGNAIVIREDYFNTSHTKSCRCLFKPKTIDEIIEKNVFPEPNTGCFIGEVQFLEMVMESLISR